MATDLETTIEYYKELLLYQYINSTKARATIGELVKHILVDLLPIEVNASFDIDNALGAQLDILGEYIGIDRNILYVVTRTNFIFNDQITPTSGTVVGFTDYNSTLNDGYIFYSYLDAVGTNTNLIDDEYRFLLKLKSYINRSNNSSSEISDILYDFFSTDIALIDQFDMTVSYYVKSNISHIVGIAFNENLLPRAMGVRISGVFEVLEFDQFWKFISSKSNNGYAIGFSDYNGAWSDSVFLSYGDRI